MTKSVSVTTGLESLVSRWISILPNSMLQELFTSVLLRPSSMTLWDLFNIFHSCKVYYRFTDGDVTLLELEAPNAAFEYEY